MRSARRRGPGFGTRGADSADTEPAFTLGGGFKVPPLVTRRPGTCVASARRPRLLRGARAFEAPAPRASRLGDAPASQALRSLSGTAGHPRLGRFGAPAPAATRLSRSLPPSLPRGPSLPLTLSYRQPPRTFPGPSARAVPCRWPRRRGCPAGGGPARVRSVCACASG